MSTATEATPDQSRDILTDRLLSQKPGLCISCQKVDLGPVFDPIANDSSQASAEELAEARAVYLEEFSLLHAYQNKNCGLCAALSKCAVLGGLSMENAGKPTSVRCCIRPKITWSSESPSQEKSTGQLKASLSGQLHVWFFEMKSRQKFARPDFDKLPGTQSQKKRSIAKRIMQLRSRSSATSKEESTSSGGPPDLFALGEAALPSQDEHGSGPDPSTDAEPSASDKISPPSLPDARVLELKSAVASWTLDVVDSLDGNSAQARAPLASHIDTKLCRTWLQECVDVHDHPETVAGISTPLPRLPLSTCLRAIHTSTGQLSALGPSEKFVALTYTWGKTSSSLAAQLAKLTHAARKGFEGWSSFPPTIRDALILARDLGFEWLWVDRLCIDQSNDAEKALLIPYMKDIFAAAQLTIVASSGSDANHGLPGTGDTKRHAEESFVVPQIGRDVKVLTTPISFNAMLQQSTWRTRGWCFEEHVFSRRLLYVFPSETFFSCAKGTFRESNGRIFSSDIAGSTWGDRGRTPPTIAGELHAQFHSSAAHADRRITLRQFVRAVEEYTSRGLSFEEDRIKAFAGVVAVAGSAQTTVANEPLLLHGHPLRFFETLLTWHNEEDQIPRKPTDGRKVSPSWSWASAGTKVYFLDNGEEHTRSHWFRYSVLAGFDVLGLPAITSFPFVSNLSLASPQPILDHKPWLIDVPQRPPGYQGHEDKPETPAHGKAVRLPMLHLVTVVFKALLAPLPEGQHCMRPIGSDSHTRTRLIGRWSLRNDPPGYNDIAKHARKLAIGRSQVSIKNEEATCQFFALVGGYNHMYIMLLEPGDEPRTFSRAGLLSLSLYGTTSAAIVPVMSQGGAAWEYIRLE